MRSLPDPELSLRDSGDFIFDSVLCRCALRDPNPRWLALLLREVIAGIHRLTVSCHLPEFTDHGLGHLCSLVDRLSRWSSSPSGSAPHLVVERLTAEEGAVLLLAILFHDIGMLSQRPEDLPPGDPNATTKPLDDVPTWVRRTHIARMDGVLRRVLLGTECEDALNDGIVQRALIVAKAHGMWPWKWDPAVLRGRDTGLAALVAVADLLDEDSARCDSATLLRHRYGTAENIAHWMRHGFTQGRVLVERSQVFVNLARPPGTDAQLDVVFIALRNHFSLIMLYLRQLGQVDAGLQRIDFNPPVGGTSLVAEELAGWEDLEGFGTQNALIFHLLGSFMPEALLDTHRLDVDTLQRLSTLGLKPVDLTEFYAIRGNREPRLPVEQTFLALLS